MGEVKAITVLHLSDMQFGKNHRFGVTVTPQGGDNPYDTLRERLISDLRTLRQDQGLAPDLMILTGDLAEWGKKSEFDCVHDLIVGLEKELSLARARLIVVPGNHDINRAFCAAYFNRCDGEGQDPAKPYCEKWEPYVEFFGRLYRDCPNYVFTFEQHWTLFEISELKVVVAGLNSTIAESHRDGDHYGLVGEPQLRWFEEKLESYRRDGWLRIGAVHHNVVRGAELDNENLRDADDLKRILRTHLNCVLHGHTHEADMSFWIDQVVPTLSTGSAAVDRDARPDEVPNQYQIIQFWPERIVRFSRAYDPRAKEWIQDARIREGEFAGRQSKQIQFQSVHATFPHERPSGALPELVKAVGVVHENAFEPSAGRLRASGEHGVLGLLVSLSGKLGVTEAAVYNMLSALGEQQVPAEQLDAKLREIAARYLDLLRRLPAMKDADPQVVKLRKDAADALRIGEYDLADDLLADAEMFDGNSIRQQNKIVQENRRILDRLNISRAETRAERGELNLVRLEYLAAAEHFSAAAVLVAEINNDRNTDYLYRRFCALYRYGDEKGDNFTLLKCIDGLKSAINKMPRKEKTHWWARFHAKLGVATMTLGMREKSTHRLSLAIQPFQEALAVWTRDRAPLEWATTQARLGDALQELGARASDVGRLEQAVGAYQEAINAFGDALTQPSTAHVHREWASTQAHLGDALIALGMRERGKKRLEQAVEAFQQALNKLSQTEMPLEWARAKESLGDAFRHLGERDNSTERLLWAVDAFHEALEVRTRERVPLAWAWTKASLGAVLTALGTRESNTERLHEAITAFSEALEERTRDRVPLEWAWTKASLGAALIALGILEDSTRLLGEALQALDEALEEQKSDSSPLEWGITEAHRADAFLALGLRDNNTQWRVKSIEAYQHAIEAFQSAQAFHYVDVLQANLDNALQGIQN